MSGEIEERLEKIEARLDRIEGVSSSSQLQDSGLMGGLPPSIQNLLDLPDTIRKTLLALQSLGESTSEEVAVKTGRTRSIETVYLNQLARLKHVSRERKSRKIYYRVVRYY